MYEDARLDGLEVFWPINMGRIAFEGNVLGSSILPENEMLPASRFTAFLQVEIYRRSINI